MYVAQGNTKLLFVGIQYSTIQKLFTTAKHSFIFLSVLRHVPGLYQSTFSTKCDLVLPLSISGILYDIKEKKAKESGNIYKGKVV